MGTSSSSKGPGAGVPMVPPWVPDVEPPQAVADAAAPPQSDAPTAPEVGPASPARQPGPLAPSGRFSGARLALGKFATTGSPRSMKRGLGRYVRSGYGGSGTAVRRFGGTAQTAGVLYGALSSAGRDQASLPGGSLDAAVLAGRSASDVMDAVVEAVRPIDGTQDAEASRAAIKDSLSELLTKFPDAELLDLTEAQRLFAVERYVAHDVYRRFRLDVGKAIQDKAPSAQSGLARLREVKDYIKETVAAAFKKVGSAAALTRREVGKLVRGALKETFAVFESYSQ
jgi:hypothetical protein